MEDSRLAVRLRVGRKVRHLRRLYGLTQEELAGFVGNQHQHIGQVERGQVNVTIDVLTRIAKRFAVDISELFRPAASDDTRPDTYLVPGQIVDQVEDALRAIERVKRSHPEQSAGSLSRKR
jgi:transcriptional regulator with XRE-family HTH domain